MAQETVKDRQLVSDQITELQKNSLRSGLDVSFANVDLAQAQAQLLLVQAQNDVQTSFAELSYALGFADQKTFDLARGTAARHNRRTIFRRCCNRGDAQSSGNHQPTASI